MNKPNKPQNPDSLHVGETVELGLTQMEISESVDKMADRYASWFGVYNDPEWNKLRLAYLAGERLGRLKQQLSEAGESKWIPISNPPKKDGVYMVWGSAYADTPMQALRCNYYKKVFRADNCNGVRTKNITHWQPLPSAPNETNLATRLYTHEQVLAFGEKVKEFAAENAMIKETYSHHVEIKIVTEYKKQAHVGNHMYTIDPQSILSIDLNKIEI